MAKKYINENQLRNIIANHVRQYLTEGLFGNSGFNFESEDDDRLSDMNSESEEESETRDSIEEFFKQPGVNCAAYAYKLYGVKAQEGQDTDEMKNARSKFAKCLNHEKNEAGYPYSFTSSELTSLKGMISSNQLNERINRAVNKTFNRLNEENLGWSNDVWDEFNYLEEVIGPEILLREIAGKLDEYTLKSILKTIKGHFAIDDDIE